LFEELKSAKLPGVLYKCSITLYRVVVVVVVIASMFKVVYNIANNRCWIDDIYNFGC